VQKLAPLFQVVNGRISTADKEQGQRAATYTHNLKDLKTSHPNVAALMTAADIQKELLSGEFTKGGSITVVLDMSVTDVEEATVQHGLKMHRRFNNHAKYFDKCNETEKKLNASMKTVYCYMYFVLFLDPQHPTQRRNCKIVARARA